MKIKITKTDKTKGRFAGLVYDIPADEAEKYIEAQEAVIVSEPITAEPEKKRKVKYGDG